jgi:hypothetical protein
MWKEVTWQVIFQVCYLSILFHQIPVWLGAHPEMHGSLWFEIFVFLQISNLVNMRLVAKPSLNVFRGISHNRIFCGVLLTMFVWTVLFVEFGGKYFRVTPLGLELHLAAVWMGMSSLLFRVIEKCLIPANFMPMKSWAKESEYQDLVIRESGADPERVKTQMDKKLD